jgi:hypothetical protein
MMPVLSQPSNPLFSATDLAALQQPHSIFQGGVNWNLTSQGISIDGCLPKGSGGAPVTIERIWRTYGAVADQEAAGFGVPIELVLACIATESAGVADAVRLEPGYLTDEETPQHVSIGLMQTLISTARATLHDDSITREFLLQPQGSIRAGTSYIAQQGQRTRYDPPAVACAYNAGSVLFEDAPGDPWRMRQYPFGTGQYADRFVDFFNDCFIVLRGIKTQAPSFVRLLAGGQAAPSAQTVHSTGTASIQKETQPMTTLAPLAQTFTQAHQQDFATHSEELQNVFGTATSLGEDFIHIWPKARPVVLSISSFVRFIPGLSTAAPVLAGLVAVADAIEKSTQQGN